MRDDRAGGVDRDKLKVRIHAYLTAIPGTPDRDSYGT